MGQPEVCTRNPALRTKAAWRIRPAPRREAGERAREPNGPPLQLGALALLEKQPVDLFLTPAPDQELQPALPRLVEVRVLDMDVEEGVAGGQDLRAGHEVGGLERQHRRGLAEAAADPALV